MKTTLPRKFEARIGGYQGFSFSAVLAGKDIEYIEFAEKFVPMATKILTPTLRQWRALEKKLDDLAVWTWKPTYLNRAVRDGTSWEFECEWGRHKIRSAGSNAFPGDADPRQPATDPINESKRFDAFLRAISQLLGGEPFE